MANKLYPKAKDSLLTQNPSIDVDTDTLKVAALTSSYTYSSAHQYYTSLAGVSGTPVTLTSKTVTDGVFDAADVTFTDVPNGTTITQLAIYKDTGSGATSPLFIHIDTATNLPVTSNGGSITVAWDNGSNKICAL